MSILVDTIEDIIEILMDDFSVMCYSFEACLTSLRHAYQIFVETNLFLNWKKCHFMAREGIFLSQGLKKRVRGWLQKYWGNKKSTTTNLVKEHS